MSDSLQPYLDLADDWAKRTDALLLANLKKLNIGVTDELYSSLQHKVYQIGSDIVGIDISFLLRGRFVDMGAGAGYKKGVFESQASNRAKLTRKPKPWYSKTFYGRLNALMGVTGASVSEQAVQAIIQPLNTFDNVSTQ